MAISSNVLVMFKRYRVSRNGNTIAFIRAESIITAARKFARSAYDKADSTLRTHRHLDEHAGRFQAINRTMTGSGREYIGQPFDVEEE